MELPIIKYNSLREIGYRLNWILIPVFIITIFINSRLIGFIVASFLIVSMLLRNFVSIKYKGRLLLDQTTKSYTTIISNSHLEPAQISTIHFDYYGQKGTKCWIVVFTHIWDGTKNYLYLNGVKFHVFLGKHRSMPELLLFLKSFEEKGVKVTFKKRIC